MSRGFPGGMEGMTPEMMQRFQQMRGNVPQGGTMGQGAPGGTGGQGGPRDTAAFRKMMQSNPELRQRMQNMRQGYISKAQKLQPAGTGTVRTTGTSSRST